MRHPVTVRLLDGSHVFKQPVGIDDILRAAFNGEKRLVRRREGEAVA
jgi:hypothetical protein